MKIVIGGVDHHAAANDILQREAVGQQAQVGLSSTAEQRGQVSGVLGVGQTLGVEVASGLREAHARAGAALVDVHGEKAAWVILRQAVDIRRNEHCAAVIVKMHRSTESGGSFASLDKGYG